MSTHNEHTSPVNSKGYMMTATGYDAKCDSAVNIQWTNKLRDLQYNPQMWFAMSYQEDGERPVHVLQEYWSQFGQQLIEAMGLVMYMADNGGVSTDDSQWQSLVAEAISITEEYRSNFNAPKWVIKKVTGPFTMETWDAGFGVTSGELGLKRSMEQMPHEDFLLFYVVDGKMITQEKYNQLITNK